jgi:hypothetical protein
MQILFAIALLCFVWILWTAIAFARHVKARHNLTEALSEIKPDRHGHHVTPATSPSTLSIAPAPENRFSLHQSVRDITANKQWAFPPRSIRMERLPIQRVPARKASSPPRKQPQPARHGPLELLDPAYFNRDMGDLTDPYQPQPPARANSRRKPRNY